MSTFEVELFIHTSPYGKDYTIANHKMNMVGYTFLESQTVTLDVPDINPSKAEIDVLKSEITKIKVSAQSEVKKIEDRIHELKCLEFKNGE